MEAVITTSTREVPSGGQNGNGIHFLQANSFCCIKLIRYSHEYKNLSRVGG